MNLTDILAAIPGGLTEVFAADGKTRLGFIQSDDLVQPVEQEGAWALLRPEDF